MTGCGAEPGLVLPLLAKRHSERNGPRTLWPKPPGPFRSEDPDEQLTNSMKRIEHE